MIDQTNVNHCKSLYWKLFQVSFFLSTDIFLVCGFSVFSSSQYFSPYVSADMTKMAQAFNTTVTALEDELTQLILEGLINARIDSHSKVKTLHTSNRCHRSFVV